MRTVYHVSMVTTNGQRLTDYATTSKRDAMRYYSRWSRVTARPHWARRGVHVIMWDSVS